VGDRIITGKGKGLDTCYSATYISQTCDQQRFTFSEVAADWHQSHRLERVVRTGPMTMFQLLIGLIQSRDNRRCHVLSSETTEVEGYENGLMPVFRSCLKSAYADF